MATYKKGTAYAVIEFFDASVRRETLQLAFFVADESKALF
jgi:hypothetical protein